MKHDGGPAFPVSNYTNANGKPGMSLRDWFAGLAMQGMISSEAMRAAAVDVGKSSNQGAVQIIVEAAYSAANAMLAERSTR